MKARRAALAAVVVGAVALAAPLAQADQGYTDPAGDANGAQDITQVDVKNDNAGNVAFVVTLPAALTDTQDLELDIDTDRNSATGDEDGAEIRIVFEGGAKPAYDFGRWNGTTIDFAATAPTLRIIYSATKVAFVLNVSDLGGARTFDFWLYSDQYAGADVSGYDVAPDGTAVWTYALDTKPVTVTVAKPTGRAAVAGAVYVASSIVTASVGSASGQVDAGVVRCAAKIAGKPLAAKGSFAGGVAACSMKLPKTSAKKLLTVTISVTVQGATGSASLTKRIL